MRGEQHFLERRVIASCASAMNLFLAISALRLRALSNISRVETPLTLPLPLATGPNPLARFAGRGSKVEHV